MKGTTLLLADEIVVPLSTTLSSLRDIGVVVDEKDLLLITQASALTKLPTESASLDTVVSIVKTSGSLGNQYLEDLTRVLKPDGLILVQTYLDSSEDLKKSTSALERKLLLSGLVEVHVDNVKPILPADGCQVVTVKAKKASWTVGQSFSIKKMTAALPKIQLDDESDLIDEDSLLTEEDLKKPIFKPVDDCEVGSTRKACKNCVCGRAEVEAVAEKVPKLGLTEEQINNPQSACGNCGLGDAFRCGTCPYKGLPPFMPGEKVSLGNFLVADI